MRGPNLTVNTWILAPNGPLFSSPCQHEHSSSRNLHTYVSTHSHRKPMTKEEKGTHLVEVRYCGSPNNFKLVTSFSFFGLEPPQRFSSSSSSFLVRELSGCALFPFLPTSFPLLFSPPPCRTIVLYVLLTLRLGCLLFSFFFLLLIFPLGSTRLLPFSWLWSSLFQFRLLFFEMRENHKWVSLNTQFPVVRSCQI